MAEEASYWDKFLYFYWEDEPQFEKTWIWASFIYGSIANYLILKGSSVSLPTKYSDMQRWVDNNFGAYGALDNWGGLTDTKVKKYNNVLGSLYSITGLNNIIHASTKAIKTPSFFLSMGYSNAREYFAWGAFVLAWAGIINQDQGLLYKSNEYLQKYIQRPQDVDSTLWKTPASTDKKFMESFALKVDDFAKERYSMDIQPFIYGSDLDGVRSFAQQMLTDAKDFTMIAVETGGFKKEESIDWGKVALGAVVALVAFNMIKR